MNDKEKLLGLKVALEGAMNAYLTDSNTGFVPHVEFSFVEVTTVDSSCEQYRASVKVTTEISV